ncbi:MAG: protein kinase [Chthoniobacterales bacterium]|nr:protein kinase [Chthoniobacterales bacterium]
MSKEATFRDFAPEQRVFGRYTLKKILGRGGMGVVWLARDEELEREVALKFLPDLVVLDKALLSDLKRETRRSLELTHKNIVRIYDFVQSENSACISMEYIDGDTLSNLRAEKEGKVFQPDEIAAWTAQLCDALDYAHNHARIIHRDLKPANLMVNQKGDLKVSDFGIARSLGDSMSKLTMASGTSGTLVYMSPQQLDGERGSHLDDIYSLGATLYDLLTGKPPFYSGNVDRQIHERSAPSMTERRREFNLEPAFVPPVWEAAVAACLAKDPAKRPPSAAQVAERLQLSAPRSGTVTVASKKQPKRQTLWIGLAAFGLVALAGFYFVKSKSPITPAPIPQAAPSPAAAIPEKSIAVLPFENLSAEESNAYFVAGVQNEILTRLSKIGALKVIARTSTAQYASKPQDVRQIGKDLDVAHLLEGSVQRTGTQVRVHVRLINAQSNSTLWADSFDRNLTDIFSVESEVAKTIADKLRAKLTGREEQVITARPTNNPAAYDAYLRGLAYSLKTGLSAADQIDAQTYLKEAVRLDPKFALAWALLSQVDAVGYVMLLLQPTPALREEARQAADTALDLQPNLAEALHAKGWYHYGCRKDYDTAARYFGRARQLLPNNSEIPEALAYVSRRQGEWDRSEIYFNEAEQLDPRNVSLLTQHAFSYIFQDRFAEALRKLDQALEITPNDPGTLAAKALIAQAEGDLPRAAKLLAPLHPVANDPFVLEAQVYQAILERQPARAIAHLNEILVKPDPALGYLNAELRFWLGWAQELVGDHAAAQGTWRRARMELEVFLKRQPDNYVLIGDLALTCSGLGDKSGAFTLAERAMAATPTSKDAMDGSIPIDILARLAAQTGESDRAIAALEKVLSIPGAGAWILNIPLTPALLRLDPMFDPLRNDPRFQKLAGSTLPK